MNDFIKSVQQKFSQDLTTTALRVLIIAWSLIVIAVALIIDNKWILAGILAYEVLP